MTCEHKWVHLPERDQLYGAFPTRAVVLIFYCEHCASVVSRYVDFERNRKASGVTVA